MAAVATVLVLSAGSGQTGPVVFTPTDSTNYAVADVTGTVNVAQATPTALTVTPVSITYGTVLANSQLTGTASATVNGRNRHRSGHRDVHEPRQA